MQVRVGSFLGGPIAAVFFLRHNFRALDRDPEARNIVVWGSAAIVCFAALLPFLPNNFPNTIVPLLYSIAAGSVADKWQLKKQAIVDSGRYEIQSNWRVFGLSLLLAMAFMVVVVIEIFCLVALHLLHL
jgi:hypothetical protein